MIDIFNWFSTYWIEITGWTIVVIGIVLGSIYRYKMLDEKKRERVAVEAEKKRKRAEDQAKKEERLALQIKDLEKNNDALEERVNRLSKLCEEQIKSNKIAYGKAMRVEGRLDERGYYADKA